MKYIVNMLILVIGIIIGVTVKWSLLIHIQPETLKEVNNSYANLIGLGISLSTALITTTYVIFTFRQMRASERATVLAEKSVMLSQLAVNSNQEMVESMKQQLKRANNPCIIPKITEANGTNCFYKDRRQLHIHIELNNIGDGPALSVYTFAWFRLKYIKNSDSDLVSMDHFPAFVPSIAINEKSICRVRFETKEIKLLIKDLEKRYALNMERIAVDPSKAVFKGADLMLKIYFKNVSNQWYEVTYICEVNKLKVGEERDNLKEVKDDEKIRTTVKEIPPRELLPDEAFELAFISELFSAIDVKLVNSEEILKHLSKYKDELGSAVEVINQN